MAKKQLALNHAPTPDLRQLVRRCAGYGLTQAQVARLLPVREDGRACDREVIRRLYAEDWEIGRAEVKAEVARSLISRATGQDGLGPPDWRAAAWWLERQGGEEWKPPDKQQQTTHVHVSAYARLSPAELEARIADMSTTIEAASQEAPTIEGTAEPAADDD